ncbi:unnamed protein product, partial [Staurois parvus]
MSCQSAPDCDYRLLLTVSLPQEQKGQRFDCYMENQQQ